MKTLSAFRLPRPLARALFTATTTLSAFRLTPPLARVLFTAMTTLSAFTLTHPLTPPFFTDTNPSRDRQGALAFASASVQS